MTREEAIKGLKRLSYEFSGYKPNEEMFDMAIKALEQEPKTGKWIDRQFKSKIDGEIRNGWECSECHESFFRYDFVNTDEFIPNFCPKCGADMRGDTE